MPGMNMTVYKAATAGREKPEIRPQTRFSDSGLGFSTTNDFEFARMILKERIYRFDMTGYVNVYEFMSEKADEELNVKKFEHPDNSWADYVMDSRAGKSQGNYDIVYSFAPTVEDYLNFIVRESSKYGKTDYDNFKEIPRPRQIIFKTQKSLSYLKIKDNQAQPVYEEQADDKDSETYENWKTMTGSFPPHDRDISACGVEEPSYLTLEKIAYNIIEYAATKTGLPCNELIKKLYRSRVYEALSNKYYKVWRFSSAALGEMLISEMESGSFIYPDADSILTLADDYCISGLEMFREREKISGREAIEIFEKYNVFDKIKREYAYYCSPPNFEYEDIKAYIESRKKETLKEEEQSKDR